MRKGAQFQRQNAPKNFLAAGTAAWGAYSALQTALAGLRRGREREEKIRESKPDGTEGRSPHGYF